MDTIVYSQEDSYPYAVCIKKGAYTEDDIKKKYINPLVKAGVDITKLVVIILPYAPNDKITITEAKNNLQILLPELQALGVKSIFCCDSPYFKALTGQQKPTECIGYTHTCCITWYTYLEVTVGVNAKSIVYNQDNEAKFYTAIDTFAALVNNNYQEPGKDIIKYSAYPSTVTEIKSYLESLHQYDSLTADCETFSLRPYEAGIGTIGFAWDKHSGIAFACDYSEIVEPEFKESDEYFGSFVPNPEIRGIIRNFIEEYKGTLIWQNAGFDLKVIIATLYMDHPLDYKGMLKGLHATVSNIHDTKLIAYLALNSTVRPSLGLKALAHEFAGNWGQDEIHDIRKIPLPELLEYNLTDCLATRYVFDKYYTKIIADDQLDIYETIFLPSIKPLVQIELVGMPMNVETIYEVSDYLDDLVVEQERVIQNSPVVAKLVKILQVEEMTKDNAKLKTKQHPLSHYADLKFNPGSSKQKIKLFYEVMDYPVLDYTAKGNPSTDADTVDKLIAQTTDPEYLELLEAIDTRNKASKIITSFIPSFKESIIKDDGRAYLAGNFILGGTVSGRLACRNPPMQTLPSNSTYGKKIKTIFEAAKGWLFVGADYNALESKINALVTRDPNKLKVFVEGYDSHSLMAHTYFKDELPGIIDTVESINSIKKIRPDLRQDSKAPTFALQYNGTWTTLVKNCGFSEDRAKQIEANYHELYQVSDEYGQQILDKACRDGYGIGAFGLKIRTPILAKTILGDRTTPKEAEAEGRTLLNAVTGQSHGMLNNRAMNAIMQRIWDSEYAEKIMPVCMIHDANYFICKDDPDTILYLNELIAQEMSWQDLPELQHDVVKLSAEMDIFYPDWSNPLTLPNNINHEELISLVKQRITSLKENK